MKLERGDIVAYWDGIAVVASISAPSRLCGLTWMIQPSDEKGRWFWNHPDCDFYTDISTLKLITKNAKTSSD